MEADSSSKLFSLAHPLEEVHPVAIKDSLLSLIDNYNLQIVFTCEEPSIAVIYNSQTGNHCVYHIRRLKTGEWVEKSEKTNTMFSSMNTSSKVSYSFQFISVSFIIVSIKLKSRLSLWDAHKHGLQVTASPVSSRGSFSSVQPSRRSHSSMAAIRFVEFYLHIFVSTKI